MPNGKSLHIRVAAIFTAIGMNGIAQPDIPRLSGADLTAIQNAVEQLVIAVNIRDRNVVRALTVPSFDARGENSWLDRDGQRRIFGGGSSDERTSDRYRGVQARTG